MVKKAIFPNLKKKVNLFLIINAFFMIPCCALAETVAKWDSEKDLFTVQSNNVTVKDVLNYIEKNSKYIFIYSEGVQKTLTDKVSISVDNKKIDVILSELSKKTGLKYKIVGRQITISRPEVESPQQDTRKGVKATGNVKDDKGEPLIGASVLVKGTTNWLMSKRAISLKSHFWVIKLPLLLSKVVKLVLFCMKIQKLLVR